MFRSLPPQSTGIDFQNTLRYSDSLTVLDFEYMFNGAGVALLDVNNDGLLDIFFTGNMVSSRLYLNKGGMKFEDITAKAGVGTTGWCYGASVADINQDGYPDIYVCKAGNRKTPADSMRNLLFINNRNNTFTESAAKMGLDDDGYDVQAAFLDYDHDGDLDLYLLRNGFVNYNRNTVRLKQTDGQAPSTNRLMRNNGNGTFSNVSAEAGITIEGFGLGVNICDINEDGWPDIYVSNDFLTNDVLWLNNRNGSFTNVADKVLRHTTYNAMGNDVADFNNDGREDIAEVDMLPPDNKRWKLTMMGNSYEQFYQGLSFGYQPQYVRNSLQLNNGDGTFSEIGCLAGVAATEWSWSPLFADFDNDGRKDLFIANGYRQDVTNLDFIMYGKKSMMGTPEANRKKRIEMLRNFPGIKPANYLFKNNGDLTFTNMAHEWGVDDETYSNGAAYGDLDNDGDLDLVVNNLDQPASVFENQLSSIDSSKKWLRIAFKGPEGNRDGLGTKVYLWQGAGLQYQYYSPYRGYLSTVEPYLHFGVGSAATDSLKVRWPDGKTQTLKNIAADRLLTLSYNDAQLQQPAITPAKPPALFTECHRALQIDYRHQEDEFVDFKMQPLLTHTLSHEGPGLAVGDMNGDGRNDFFVGAAAGYKGSLFMQQANGKFTSQTLPYTNAADNMGALLADLDNDGDNDLFVVNGGTCEKKNGDPVYAPALYLNNGKGEFTAAPAALPVMNTSGSSVVAADYDHDGDLDLFICGRQSPGEYPMPARSFLLRNDSRNGNCVFTDVTKASGIPEKPGMVTSALFTDFNNDGWQDLIIAGEFMPILFFKNTSGHFTNVSEQTGLTHTGGWWNSLVAGDFDNDGDIDYIAGNLGLNGPYKASSAEPVCIYAGDYDKNGRIDPVMCHFENGNEYTVHSREDMNKQIPAMRSRFGDFAAYAAATFQQSFSKAEIASAYVVKAETFSSALVENLGGGKFALHTLPVDAQFAPIYGMVCGDFNDDGNLDVLCAGNSYATEVQTGRYDAQGTVLLTGNGKGHFTASHSAINVVGDNKSLCEMTLADGAPLFLIGSNNDSLRAYRAMKSPAPSVKIKADDVSATVNYKDGTTRRQEFYYGSSYLSQSERCLIVSPGMSSITFYNTTGGKKIVKF